MNVDDLEGITSPPESPKLIGHTRLVGLFLDAAQRGKLHHAWLLAGAEGIGKATFAWHAGRYLLDPEGGAPTRLERPSETPIQRQISAGGARGFFVLQPEIDEKTKRKRREIIVEQVRKLKARLALSNPENAYQVVIIDAAEDLNINAANALLKLLEEPPPRVVFFLVSHRPGCLLAPLRSRCITHRLFALGEQDFKAVLAQIGLTSDPLMLGISEGSPGIALRLHAQNGTELYKMILALFGERARLKRPALTRLGEALSGRENQDNFGLFITLLQIFFARLARASLSGDIKDYLSEEIKILEHYEKGTNTAQNWAMVSEDLCARLTQGRNVNIDPASLIIDMGGALEKTMLEWGVR